MSRWTVLAALLLPLGCDSDGGGAVPGSEYHAHRGGPLDTFAMVALTGSPNDWSDPRTADWPTVTLEFGGLIRGHHWEVWKDAILARNPSLTVATFVEPTWAELQSADAASPLPSRHPRQRQRPDARRRARRDGRAERPRAERRA